EFLWQELRSDAIRGPLRLFVRPQTVLPGRRARFGETSVLFLLFSSLCRLAWARKFNGLLLIEHIVLKSRPKTMCYASITCYPSITRLAGLSKYPPLRTYPSQ